MRRAGKQAGADTRGEDGDEDEEWEDREPDEEE
jgi:hypothetical protein